MTNLNKELQNQNEKLCEICPRKCGVDRLVSLGFCKSKNLRIARHSLHFWEEPCISGTCGSGTIFFSGCSLRCVYCQNFQVSQHSKGMDISVHDLANIFKELESQGAHNINLVTPTHYAKEICEAIDIYKPKIPICYNTSGYERKETIKQLANYVDIFLTDFKYADSTIAQKYSHAKDYPEIAKIAILQMRENQPKDIFSADGIMQKGVLVRHMVLPNCLQNSKEVLEWIAKNLGTNTLLSIMNQYTPFGNAKDYPEINRKLKPLEYKIITNYALKLGFDNAFVQESASSDEQFIPKFFGENLL